MSNDLKDTAQRLVARFGADTARYVQDRIDGQFQGGDRRELDGSYPLLSEVEKLLEQET